MAARRKRLRHACVVTVLFVFGAGGYWLTEGFAANGLHGALTWGFGLATGCLVAMGRQRWIEAGAKR